MQAITSSNWFRFHFIGYKRVLVINCQFAQGFLRSYHRKYRAVYIYHNNELIPNIKSVIALSGDQTLFGFRKSMLTESTREPDIQA